MAAYYSTRITTAAIVPNLKILLHYIRQTITLMHARGELFARRKIRKVHQSCLLYCGSYYLLPPAAIYSTDLQSKASNFQGKGKGFHFGK